MCGKPIIATITGGYCAGNGPAVGTYNYLGTTSNLATPVQNSIVLVFPDSVTGVFEIVITIEGTGLLYVGTVPSITVSGNVTTFSDIYGSAANPSGSPSAFAYAVSGGVVPQFIFIGRVTVSPSTAGVDNVVNIQIPFNPAGSINQAAVWVRQMNPTYAASNAVAAPLYTNTSGVVTTVA